ncbi:MAG: 50S ribosomal protein L25 [Deltaproteobacteria bacterium]|nr:50S ribosomal protein L25 [Deltaproteobacteria bacterium]
MEAIELSVESRTGSGKGAARAVRRTGKVPAILYGAARSATLIALDAKEFETKVGAIEGTHLIRLTSSDAELGGRLVLVKEVQRDPVARALLHTDLYEVDVNTKLRLKVALHFIGRAAGVDVGGILQPVRREVEVLCLPTEIPDYIEVDVSALGIHDAVHLSDLKAPSGVEIVIDTDEAVVTVLPPVVEEVKVASEGEAAATEAGAVAPAEGAKADAAKAGAAKPAAAKS